MPGQNKQETFVLKHRLAGAAILIGFAVIVLPMLLGSPEDAYQDQSNDSTVGDSQIKVFHSNITPIGGATPNAQEQERKQDNPDETVENRPASPPPASGDEETTEPVKTADIDRPDEQQEAETRSADKGTDVAVTDDKEQGKVTRGWIVQVGTFKNPGNVKGIIGKLEKGGFAPSTTEVDTSGGSATRVWVGPFETRVEAARIKTRVKQKTGSEGLIVAYP